MEQGFNEIEIIFAEDECSSLAYVDKKAAGECQYQEKDDKWYIIHTGVREEFGGHGIAKLLVLKIVEEARKRGIKIVPICSYAQKVLSKDEYKDIVE